MPDEVPIDEQIAAVRHYLNICRQAGASAHNTRPMRAVLETLLRLKQQKAPANG